MSSNPLPQQAQRSPVQSTQRPSTSRLSQLQLGAFKSAGVKVKTGTALTTSDLKLPNSDRYITPDAATMTAEDATLWMETNHIAEADLAFEDLLQVAQTSGPESEVFNKSCEVYAAKQAAAFSDYEFKIEKAKHSVASSEAEISRLESEKGWCFKAILGFNKAQDKAIAAQQELLTEQKEKLAELTKAKSTAESLFDQTMRSLQQKEFTLAQDLQIGLSANLKTDESLTIESYKKHIQNIATVSESYEKVARYADYWATGVRFVRDTAIAGIAIAATTALLAPTAVTFGAAVVAGILAGAFVYGVGGILIHGAEMVGNITIQKMSYGEAGKLALGNWARDLPNILLNGIPAGLGAKVTNYIAQFGEKLGFFQGIGHGIRAIVNIGSSSFAQKLTSAATTCISIGKQILPVPLVKFFEGIGKLHSGIREGISTGFEKVASFCGSSGIGSFISGCAERIATAAGFCARALVYLPRKIIEAASYVFNLRPIAFVRSCASTAISYCAKGVSYCVSSCTSAASTVIAVPMRPLIRTYYALTDSIGILKNTRDLGSKALLAEDGWIRRFVDAFRASFRKNGVEQIMPSVPKEVAQSQALWNARVFGASNSFMHNFYDVFIDTKEKTFTHDANGDPLKEPVVINVPTNREYLAGKSMVEKLMAISFESTLDTVSIDMAARYGLRTAELNQFAGVIRRSFNTVIGGTKTVAVESLNTFFKSFNNDIDLSNGDFVKDNITRSLVGYFASGQILNEAIAAQHRPPAHTYQAHKQLQRHSDQPNSTDQKSKASEYFQRLSNHDGSASTTKFRVKTSEEINALQPGAVYPFEPAVASRATKHLEPAVTSPATQKLADNLNSLDITLIAVDHSLLPGQKAPFEFPSTLFPEKVHSNKDVNYDSSVVAPLKEYLVAKKINVDKLNTASELVDALNKSGLLARPIPAEAKSWTPGLNESLVDVVVRSINTKKLQKYALKEKTVQKGKDPKEDTTSDNQKDDALSSKALSTFVDKSKQKPKQESEPVSLQATTQLTDLALYVQRFASGNVPPIKSFLTDSGLDGKVYNLVDKDGRKQLLFNANKATLEDLSEAHAQILFEQHSTVPAQQLAKQWGMGWSGFGNFAKQLSTEQRNHIASKSELAGLHRILESVDQLALNGNEPLGAKSLRTNDSTDRISPRSEKLGLKSNWSELKHYWVNRIQMDIAQGGFNTPLQWGGAVLPESMRLKIDATEYSRAKKAENYVLEERRKYFRGDHELNDAERRRLEDIRFPYLRDRNEAQNALTSEDLRRNAVRKDQEALEKLFDRYDRYHAKESKAKEADDKFVAGFEQNLLRREKSANERTSYEELNYQRAIRAEARGDKLKGAQLHFFNRAKFEEAAKFDPTKPEAELAKIRDQRVSFVANQLLEAKGLSSRKSSAESKSAIENVVGAQTLNKVTDTKSAHEVAQELLTRYEDTTLNEPQNYFNAARETEDFCRLTAQEQAEYQYLRTLVTPDATMLTHRDFPVEVITPEQQARLTELTNLRNLADRAAEIRHRIKNQQIGIDGHLRGNDEVTYDELNEILAMKHRSRQEVKDRPNYDPLAWRSHLGRILSPISPLMAGHVDEFEEVFKAKWWLQSQIQRIVDWNIRHDDAPRILANTAIWAGFIGSSYKVGEALLDDEPYTLIHGMMHDQINKSSFSEMMLVQEMLIVENFKRMMLAMGDNDPELERINKRFNIELLDPHDNRIERRAKSEEEYEKGWLFVAPPHHQRAGEHYTKSQATLEANGFATFNYVDVREMRDSLLQRPELPLFNLSEKARTTLTALGPTDALRIKYIDGYDWNSMRILPKSGGDTDAKSTTLEDYVLYLPPSEKHKGEEPLLLSYADLNQILDKEAMQSATAIFSSAQKELISLMRSLPEDHWYRSKYFNPYDWSKAEIKQNSFGLQLFVPHHDSVANTISSWFYPNNAKPLILSAVEISSMAYEIRNGKDSELFTPVQKHEAKKKNS